MISAIFSPSQKLVLKKDPVGPVLLSSYLFFFLSSIPLNSDLAGSKFYPNLFRYVGTPPATISAVWPCAIYFTRYGKHARIDYVVNVESNTGGGNDTFGQFFGFGITLSSIKSDFFPSDTIKTIQKGECIYYKKSTGILDQTITGYGGYSYLDTTNNLLKFGRYYDKDGREGAWSLKTLTAGVVIKGSLNIIFQ